MVKQLSEQPGGEPIESHRLPSLRRRLLLTVNLALGVGLVVVIALDYRNELAGHLNHRRVAMQEEATLLLPILQQLRRHGMPSVQEYIDAACGQMQDTTSPAHHIAVRFGSDVLQAQTHHRASAEMLRSMEMAANRADHEASVAGQPILVGSAVSDDAVVYVSEAVSDVLRASRWRALVRAMQVFLLGLMATALTDWILVRLVVRPIRQLVTTVRCIAQGQLGNTVKEASTAEFQFLAAEINAMSVSLKAAERERQRQLEKARRIQQKLQPSAAIASDWCIASLYAPAEAVGGDYLDYRQIEPRLLVCCVADVTGHGVPAALGAAMLKVLFDAAVLQSREPARILKFINNAFHGVTLEGDFASMLIAVMDPAARALRYASAGHEPCYLMHDDGHIESVNSTGFVLGIEPDAEWEMVELKMGPGDRLVLLTDGWAEMVTRDGSLLGREQLRTIVREAKDLTPEQAVRRMALRVKEVADEHRQPDDLALLVAQWPSEMQR